MTAHTQRDILDLASRFTGIPGEPPPPAAPKLRAILEAVAHVARVDVAALISPRRQRRLVDARHVYFHVAAKHTSASLVKIARHCGDRDHSTVRNGLARISADPARYCATILAVEARLNLKGGKQ